MRLWTCHAVPAITSLMPGVRMAREWAVLSTLPTQSEGLWPHTKPLNRDLTALWIITRTKQHVKRLGAPVGFQFTVNQRPKMVKETLETLSICLSLSKPNVWHHALVFSFIFSSTWMGWDFQGKVGELILPQDVCDVCDWICGIIYRDESVYCMLSLQQRAKNKRIQSLMGALYLALKWMQCH